MFQALQDFTGKDWEQEDDVTFVTLERTAQKESGEDSMQKIGKFTIESWPGKEREAVEKVNSIIDQLNLPENKHKKLETAIAEATMNAMEHGNKYDPEIPVIVKIFASPSSLSIQITDQGKQEHILEAEAPNLDAKLAGKQSPRGWGLFLIKNMVDDLKIHNESESHTIELILNLEGGTSG